MPHLNDPLVEYALTLGLKSCRGGYTPGTPPCRCGTGPGNGQRTRRGCLSWYQPWNRCHHIAPFCWAIGMKVYPELNWEFISGEKHTVVIGWSDDWEAPEWVMDILLFRRQTAAESLKFAMEGHWDVYPTLEDYMLYEYDAEQFQSLHRSVAAMFPTLELSTTEAVCGRLFICDETRCEKEAG